MLTLAGLSACCSASETTFFSLTGNDRIRLRRTSPALHTLISALLAEPRRLLVGLLLLNTTVNVGYAVTASVLARKYESGVLGVLFTLLTLVVLVIACEILPKVFASVHRVKLVKVLAPPAYAAMRVLGPVLEFMDHVVVTPLARLARPAGAGEAPPLTADDLSTLLEVSAPGAGLEEGEQAVLSAVLQLGDLRVRDAMTPRVDLRWVEQGATEAEVLKLVRETGHTKFPVCRGSLDGGVLGLLNAKEFLAACAASTGPRPMALGHARPVPFVPDRSRMDRLLETFRRTGAHVAMVVDEYGQIVGMIEVADIVSILVATQPEGPEELGGVTAVGPGEWLVPGRLEVRRLVEALGQSEGTSPDRGVTTLAGLVFSRLGRVPRVGDRILVGSVRLTVAEMEGKRVSRVRVSLAERGAA